METYSVLTSWGLFGAAALVAIYYYWPEPRRAGRGREDAPRRRRAEQDGRQRQQRAGETEHAPAPATFADAVKHGGGETTKKRKVQTREPPQASAPAAVVQAEEPDDFDNSTKQFAEQMAQARKGKDLTSKNTKENRVKTVKQNNALNGPAPTSDSSQAGAEGDDDLSPVASNTASGDVSDMLEPVAPGPSTLRVTAPTQPQKEKQVRKAKEEVVETKKQRQNRQRVEAQRLQRETDEKERKALEEKQRRAARTARGEPAKNGIPASKAPTSNAWQASKANGASSAPAAAANQSAPLLDTFDVESNSSSNGGLEASTTATSTSSAGAAQWDRIQSEEHQLAQAMRQSEDESGWTTVAQPKKQKQKKTTNGEVTPIEPVLTNNTNVMPTKPAVNGKPKGFQALEVQYEQRTDADPSDASNWDA